MRLLRISCLVGIRICSRVVWSRTLLTSNGNELAYVPYISAMVMMNLIAMIIISASPFANDIFPQRMRVSEMVNEHNILASVLAVLVSVLRHTLNFREGFCTGEVLMCTVLLVSAFLGRLLLNEKMSEWGVTSMVICFILMIYLSIYSKVYIFATAFTYSLVAVLRTIAMKKVLVKDPKIAPGEFLLFQSIPLVGALCLGQLVWGFCKREQWDRTIYSRIFWRYAFFDTGVPLSSFSYLIWCLATTMLTWELSTAGFYIQGNIYTLFESLYSLSNLWLLLPFLPDARGDFEFSHKVGVYTVTLVTCIYIMEKVYEIIKLNNAKKQEEAYRKEEAPSNETILLKEHVPYSTIC